MRYSCLLTMHNAFKKLSHLFLTVIWFKRFELYEWSEIWDLKFNPLESFHVRFGGRYPTVHIVNGGNPTILSSQKCLVRNRD